MNTLYMYGIAMNRVQDLCFRTTHCPIAKERKYRFVTPHLTLTFGFGNLDPGKPSHGKKILNSYSSEAELKAQACCWQRSEICFTQKHLGKRESIVRLNSVFQMK